MLTRPPGLGQAGERYTRGMSVPDLPVACTLTPADLATRRGALLPGLAARASASTPIDGGRAWRFDFAAGLLAEIAAVVEAEHRCCPFLRFALTVEPGNGPVSLAVVGPAGTVEFLESLLA
jgi:hypothetical protein